MEGSENSRILPSPIMIQGALEGMGLRPEGAKVVIVDLSFILVGGPASVDY